MGVAPLMRPIALSSGRPGLSRHNGQLWLYSAKAYGSIGTAQRAFSPVPGPTMATAGVGDPDLASCASLNSTTAQFGPPKLIA